MSQILAPKMAPSILQSRYRQYFLAGQHFLDKISCNFTRWSSNPGVTDGSQQGS